MSELRIDYGPGYRVYFLHEGNGSSCSSPKRARRCTTPRTSRSSRRSGGRSTPALLKGFLDRALLPQEEYRYAANGLPQGLLAGRSGRVIASADTPAVLAPIMPGTRLAALRRGTLGLCGIKPLRMRYLGPVKGSSDETRAAWLELVARDGARDARRAPASPPARAVDFAPAG